MMASVPVVPVPRLAPVVPVPQQEQVVPVRVHRVLAHPVRALRVLPVVLVAETVPHRA